MKKRYKIIITILLLISAIFINKEVQALLPLSGKVIIVDAGHGGVDPGTTKDNIYEKDINLAISKYLELELTESACFNNEKRFEEAIHTLKDLGFVVSMDDFGTGYSSLNMLRNLPIDILKLDRGFIKDTIISKNIANCNSC